jgi:hypothetical protein
VIDLGHLRKVDLLPAAVPVSCVAVSSQLPGASPPNDEELATLPVRRDRPNQAHHLHVPTDFEPNPDKRISIDNGGLADANLSTTLARELGQRTIHITR